MLSCRGGGRAGGPDLDVQKVGCRSAWEAVYVWSCLGKNGEDLGTVKVAQVLQPSPQGHQGLQGQMFVFNNLPG